MKDRFSQFFTGRPYDPVSDPLVKVVLLPNSIAIGTGVPFLPSFSMSGPLRPDCPVVLPFRIVRSKIPIRRSCSPHVPALLPGVSLHVRLSQLLCPIAPVLMSGCPCPRVRMFRSSCPDVQAPASECPDPLVLMSWPRCPNDQALMAGCPFMSWFSRASKDLSRHKSNGNAEFTCDQRESGAMTGWHIHGLETTGLELALSSEHASEPPVQRQINPFNHSSTVGNPSARNYHCPALD